MKVWARLEAYYKEHEHLRVPISDTKLGSAVHDIRSRNNFLWHADFKAWLDERGFVYDARRAHLEDEVWPKFMAYYKDHKHLRVPQSDPELGRVVTNIRNKNYFLWHEDFKAWLDERGFIYDPHRAHLEDEVWPKFMAYYKDHEHLRVPQSDPKLGMIVCHIRNRNNFLWLYERGFKMHATNARKNAERWAALNEPPLAPGDPSY